MLNRNYKENGMYRLGTSPLMVSGVFKHGWRLYKSSLPYVLVWSLILALIHEIPDYFKIYGIFLDLSGHLVFSWVGVMVLLVLMIAEAFFLAVMFYSMFSLAKIQKIDLIGAFVCGEKHLWQLYLTLVIYAVLVHIGVILLLIPALFVGVLFAMILAPYLTER